MEDQVQVRISKDKRDQIKAVAALHGITLDAMLDIALDEWLMLSDQKDMIISIKQIGK